MSKTSVKAKVNISNVTKNLLSEVNTIGTKMVDDFSEHLAKLAKMEVERIINEDIYQNNSFTGGEPPLVYERTYDVLNAVVVTKLSNGKWSVKLDGRKIHARPANTYTDAWGQHSGWGQHSDFNGEPSSALMASFIEYGVNSDAYSYEGIHVFERATEYINSIVKSEWDKFSASYKPKNTKRKG